MEVMWSIIGWMGLRGISVRSFFLVSVFLRLCKDWFCRSLRERNALYFILRVFGFLH
jgi:hypothetical protein